MNPVLKALMAGYGINEVLGFISNAIPGMGSKISKARNSGYSTDQIIKFIGQTMDNEKYPKNMSANEIHALKSQKYGDITKKAAGTLGAIGLGAAGAGIASMASGMGSPQQGATGAAIQPSAILPPLQNNPMQGQKGIGFNPAQIQQQPPQQLIQGTVQPPSPGPQPSPAPGMPNAPTNQTPIVPPGQEAQQPVAENPMQATQPQQSAEILQQMGLKEHVDNMLQAGNQPLVISSIVSQKLPPQIRPQLQGLIEDYAANFQPQANQPPQDVQPTNNQTMPNSSKEDEIPPNNEVIPPVQEKIPTKVKEPDKKGNIVSTSTGLVGEIKGISGNNALIEENGKVKKVPLEEIEEPDENVIEAVNNILKIPEKDRSAIVSLYTYDPSTRTFDVQYHTGDSYRYYDIDDELVKEAARAEGIPITEGKNIFGAWSPEDKKSIGATLIQKIINNPKYKKPKKGDPENPNYRKLETLYDYWKDLRKKPKRKRK